MHVLPQVKISSTAWHGQRMEGGLITQLQPLQAVLTHLNACKWKIELLLGAAFALNSHCICYCCSSEHLLLLLLP
jgi:hypothetical protein